MSTDFPFDVITADAYDRLRDVHEPLTQSLRRLIEAGIRTGVDSDTIRDARAAIDAVAETLERSQSDTTSTLRHAGTGRPLAWANPAVGLRNAIAPPMPIHQDGDGGCWSEFSRGAAYAGPPGLRYLRGTPLGPLRAEAFIERTEGIKTYARGYLVDGEGRTVEADGVFIAPAWARDPG